MSKETGVLSRSDFTSAREILQVALRLQRAIRQHARFGDKDICAVCDDLTFLFLTHLIAQIEKDRQEVKDEWTTDNRSKNGLVSFLRDALREAIQDTEICEVDDLRSLLVGVRDHKNKDFVHLLAFMPEDIELFFLRMMTTQQNMLAAPPPSA